MLTERHKDTKGHILYEMSRIGKSIGTGSRFVVAKCREVGMIAQEYGVFLTRWWKYFLISDDVCTTLWVYLNYQTAHFKSEFYAVISHTSIKKLL